MPERHETGTGGLRLENVVAVSRHACSADLPHQLFTDQPPVRGADVCEIDPAASCPWFMERFIDAYDWVMVPNVFGRSQHADGGLITTQPYRSGLSYVLKMSNFRKGPWCAVWDALYWRFSDRHREFFAGDPRMSVMAAPCERMGRRLDEHRRTAEQFLTRLHGES